MPACAACRVDVEDACVPSTCLHNCAACNSYFLRRLLCGRPSDWAFPGVTAVGSAHWRTSIRSSVLTVCATPLLRLRPRPRPRPQSPQQAPQETAHYLRSSFRTLATAPPSLRLSSTFAPIVAQPAALHLAAAPVFYPPQAIPVGRATRGQRCLPCPAQFQLLPAPPQHRSLFRSTTLRSRSQRHVIHAPSRIRYLPPPEGWPTAAAHCTTLHRQETAWAVNMKGSCKQ